MPAISRKCFWLKGKHRIYPVVLSIWAPRSASYDIIVLFNLSEAKSIPISNLQSLSASKYILEAKSNVQKKNRNLKVISCLRSFYKMFHPNDNSALFHLCSSYMRGIKAYKCDGRDLLEENVISACARSPIDEKEKSNRASRLVIKICFNLTENEESCAKDSTISWRNAF